MTYYSTGHTFRWRIIARGIPFDDVLCTWWWLRRDRTWMRREPQCRAIWTLRRHSRTSALASSSSCLGIPGTCYFYSTTWNDEQHQGDWVRFPSSPPPPPIGAWWLSCISIFLSFCFHSENRQCLLTIKQIAIIAWYSYTNLSIKKKLRYISYLLHVLSGCLICDLNWRILVQYN